VGVDRGVSSLPRGLDAAYFTQYVIYAVRGFSRRPVWDGRLHCVLHLKTFGRAAAEVGLTEAEIESIEQLVARDPLAGVAIAGTGGCRKIRIAGRGRGKRGGYRVVTFYSGVDIPVMLITVFGKGEKDNLTKRERNELARLTKELVEAYRPRVAKVGVQQ
jgi:hypothetical protein